MPVREFRRSEVNAVADLWVRVFRQSRAPAPEPLVKYIDEMFFLNPWYDAAYPSYVFEDSRQRIVGFLGVHARPMLFCNERITSGVGTQFCVDPGTAQRQAARDLLKAVFTGPYDLVFSDGSTHRSPRLWQSVGAQIAFVQSLDWVRLLRPLGHAVNRLRRDGHLTAAAAVLSPLAPGVDNIAMRYGRSPYRLSAPGGSREEGSAEALYDCIVRVEQRRALRPYYDIESLRWVLNKAKDAVSQGTLRISVVRGRTGDVVGWYVFYMKPGGTSTVIQLGCRPHGAAHVFEHLFDEARRGGSTAVAGQAQPDLLLDISQARASLTCKSLGVVVQSRRPEIIAAIQRGDAFLSRLEGEWWMNFSQGAWA
jgi:GNAT acetyltransferase-like protein